MRVLHLSSVYAPHAVGGAERVVQALAEGCAAHGVETAVAHIAPHPGPPALRNGVKVFPLRHRNPLWIEEVARHSGPVRNFNKLATLFNVLTAADFDRLLAEYQPDIVHSHSMVELTPRMWKLARARGAGVVHTLHDYDLLCIRAALFKDGRRCERQHLACAAFSAVKRHYHRHVGRVVGVLRAILDTHLQRGLFQGVSEDRRHVIWNPVKLRAGGMPHAPDVSRQGPYTFGFIGRLVPEKGLFTLLDACTRLGPGDWRLKIAGRAPGDDDAALKARAAGLPVEFMGFTDPDEFLRGIDRLVVPSIWLEPFGLTIVEAYAAGVPVLGADIAGVAEIIRAVDPSALVPKGDADALAAAMARAVASGRGAARVDFSPVLRRTQPTQVVRQYIDVYRACLADRAALVVDDQLIAPQ